MNASEWVTLLAVCLLGYAWCVYPLALGLLPRRRETWAPPKQWPEVAVVLSACDEEAVIEARIRNLLDSSYPPERLRICVGVDGGTDRTADIAQDLALGAPNVRVHVRAERRGKAAMLKQLIGACEQNIVVLTDANTSFAPDAIERLVGPLGDDVVGGVCGELVFRAAAEGRTDENTYWRWEKRLKEAESSMDSCLGANGAIYAVRRSLFPDIPDNTITDDFVIGMKIREQGRRMVYEPLARAVEELPPSVGQELRRRVRIGVGDYQAIGLCRRCLSPRYGRFALAFWSHKVLRWFTPHLLVVLGVATLWSVGRRIVGEHPAVWTAGARLVGICLAAQAFFYGCAVLGFFSRGAGGRTGRFFRGCNYFLVMQVALGLGFFRFLRGGLSGAWDRTPRSTVEQHL